MKIVHKLQDILRFLTRFPFEEKYREQLELDVIAMNYRSERLVAVVIMFMQIFMILTFTMRPGSIFLNYRRLRYVITDAVLLTWFLVFLPLHKRSIHNWRQHSRICTMFGILLCLWVVSISYLDSLGGVSIIVYCSTLPAMAIFLVVPPFVLSILFLFTCALTDVLVLTTPYGQENVFSVLVNSIFMCLLSIIYAYRIYSTRLTSVYDRMIIDQKNKQLEAANKELDMRSMTDALTALGNRRYLEEGVRAPLERYGIHMGSLTVFLLDIDHFKQYNDRYGHQMGDACLQAVASELSSYARDNDFRAVRYGGEEFILVMCGLKYDLAVEKAEQIRQSIAAVRIPGPAGSETTITVSMGISFHPSWETGLLDTAISQADQAMYRAKQQGRNRVVLFGNGEQTKALQVDALI